MNFKKILSQLVEFCQNLATRFSKLGETSKRVVNVSVILLVAFLLWSWFDATFLRTEFEFLAGPQKSAGSEFASEITKHFNASNGNALRRNKMKDVVTDGFMENQKTIGEDHNGHVVGFGQIGFGDTANSRVLLPLEFNYLHIISRSQLYDEIATLCGECKKSLDTMKAKPNGGPSDGTDTSPQTNLDFQEKKLGLFELLYAFQKNMNVKDQKAKIGRDIKPLRIAAGSPGSGTQFLAKKIFQHFGIVFGENGLSADGAYFLDMNVGADQAQSMMLNNDVDIVFSLSPANSTYVAKFHNHGFLLGLGEDAKAIPKQISKTVLDGKLADGLYGNPVPDGEFDDEGIAVPSPYSKRGLWFLSRPRFCEEISVLRTRRALICSKNMSNQHAYSIASAARDALSEAIPSINWDKLDDQNNNDLANVVKFHEGAKLLRDDKSPGIFDKLYVQWEKYRSLFFVTALSIILSFLNGLFKSSEVPNDDGEVANEVSVPDGPRGNEASAPLAENSEIDNGSVSELQELAFRRIATAIDALMVELQLESRDMSRTKYKNWKTKLESLRLLVIGRGKIGKISSAQEESLINGHDELKYLFDSEFNQRTTSTRG